MIVALIMALGIALSATAGLIYFARMAVQRADGKGDAMRDATIARGESAVDAIKVDQANAATAEIARARDVAEDRHHATEQALHDQAVAVVASGGDGDELLRASLATDPAPTGRTDKGDHGAVNVPDGAAGRSSSAR